MLQNKNSQDQNQKQMNLSQNLWEFNAGIFQEYDYNNEDAECEWKQVTEYWRLNSYTVNHDSN